MDNQTSITYINKIIFPTLLVSCQTNFMCSKILNNNTINNKFYQFIFDNLIYGVGEIDLYKLSFYVFRCCIKLFLN